ncbi:MAG: hypothetical protein AVW06_00995 [Hadesarchaea archaeon DG-33-1]|nr:MAG: hypothetical protein AVW06_00995 [Hadesarchaea archaeon DG-33-1]
MARIRVFLLLLVFGALVTSASAAVLSNLASVEIRGEPGDSLVLVDNCPAPAVLRLELIDSQGDGFPDRGSLVVTNRGDFKLRGRIANLGVRLDYEDNSSVGLLTELYDRGKWNFYLDSDGNRWVSENDVKFGEVWIKHGTYFLDEDEFSVSERNSKELKVELKYQPYAPGKSEGVEFYAVTFDMVMLENRR